MVSVSTNSDHSVTTSEYNNMGAVQAFGRALVKREQFRAGGCIDAAIARVAERLKTPAGTLANIIKNRVKGVCFNLGQKIINAAICDIENERKQLEHEREILMSVVTPENADDLVAVEAALQAARSGIARLRGGK